MVFIFFNFFLIWPLFRFSYFSLFRLLELFSWSPRYDFFLPPSHSPHLPSSSPGFCPPPFLLFYLCHVMMGIVYNLYIRSIATHCIGHWAHEVRLVRLQKSICVLILWLWIETDTCGYWLLQWPVLLCSSVPYLVISHPVATLPVCWASSLNHPWGPVQIRARSTPGLAEHPHRTTFTQQPVFRVLPPDSHSARPMSKSLFSLTNVCLLLLLPFEADGITIQAENLQFIFNT